MFLTNNLDKQLNRKVVNYARKRNIEVDNQNIEEVRQWYLENNPKIAREHNYKINKLSKIEKGVVMGTIGVAALAGVAFVGSRIGNDGHQEKPKTAEELVTTMEPEEQLEEIEEVSPRDELIQELQENRDDDYINKLRKEIIVEEYNKLHPEDKISADRLGIIQSHSYLIENHDKLGNIVSLNRQLVGDAQKLEENQTVNDGYLHYIYTIDDETVAIYTIDGNPVQDKGKTNDDTFFQTTVPLVNSSESLKYIYNYPSTEDNKKEKEEHFADTAMQFKEIYKDKTVEKDIEKEN